MQICDVLLAVAVVIAKFSILTIIPLALVGYEIANEARSAELAIVISYPTSARGIIVLLKTSPKYRKLDYNKNKKS